MSKTVSLVIGVAAAMLLVSSCSSGGPSASAPRGTASTSPAPQPIISESVTLAYSKCMRSHGIASFPDPDSKGGVTISSGINTSSKTYLTAASACQPLNSKPLPPLPPVPANPAAALKYAKCMRVHGVPKFPLPGKQDNFDVNGATLGVNPNGKVYKSAASACESDMN